MSQEQRNEILEVAREAIRTGTEMGKKARSFTESGSLVPDEVVIGIIREFLGSGSFFGIQVMDFKIGFFTNSAGAFFVYGICIALFVLITDQADKARRAKQARLLRVPAGDQPLPAVESSAEEVK